MKEDLQLKKEGRLLKEEGEEGIPEKHFPAIWGVCGKARNGIMERTGLELAVEAYVEDIRTSHRGREYVRH